MCVDSLFPFFACLSNTRLNRSNINILVNMAMIMMDKGVAQKLFDSFFTLAIVSPCLVFFLTKLEKGIKHAYAYTNIHCHFPFFYWNSRNYITMHTHTHSRTFYTKSFFCLFLLRCPCFLFWQKKSVIATTIRRVQRRIEKVPPICEAHKKYM